jgi:hypothetical protein
MFTLPSSVRILVATAPTDLRKSFDGLSAAVEYALGHDPLLGSPPVSPASVLATGDGNIVRMRSGHSSGVTPASLGSRVAL